MAARRLQIIGSVGNGTTGRGYSTFGPTSEAVRDPAGRRTKLLLAHVALELLSAFAPVGHLRQAIALAAQHGLSSHELGDACLIAPA
jgi:hypothetical protein